MFSLFSVLVILIMVLFILKVAWLGLMSIGALIFLAVFTAAMLLGTVFDGGTIIILMILLITGIIRGRKPQG